MAAAAEGEWGLIFAETMQGVLKDKADGTPNAMSKFMHRETSKPLWQNICEA